MPPLSLFSPSVVWTAALIVSIDIVIVSLLHFQASFPQIPTLWTNNFTTIAVDVDSTTRRLVDWQIILSNDTPYSNVVPQLNVVWSRGWYTTKLFPGWIPIMYYNSMPSEKGRFWHHWNMNDIFQPYNHSFSNQYLWVRREADFDDYFRKHIWSANVTNLTLVTTDGDGDLPNNGRMSCELLAATSNTNNNNGKLTAWYTQNMVWWDHPKVKPLPIGLDLHTPFSKGGETPVDIVHTLQNITATLDPTTFRPARILYDHGTTITGNNEDLRRTLARQELANAIETCIMNDTTSITSKSSSQSLFHIMNWTDNKISAWKLYGSLQFGLAPTGMGWDTHRMWEFLFFGTIPIVKSSPLDILIIEAHVPVIILQDWSELCTFNTTEMIQVYGSGWIQRAHEWLLPGLWLPRNQSKMNEICDSIPHCKSVYEKRKHLLEKWKAPSNKCNSFL